MLLFLKSPQIVTFLYNTTVCTRSQSGLFSSDNRCGHNKHVLQNINTFYVSFNSLIFIKTHYFTHKYS